MQERIGAVNVSQQFNNASKRAGRDRAVRALNREADLVVTNRDSAVDAVMVASSALASPANVFLRRGDSLWVVSRAQWRRLIRDLEAEAERAEAEASAPVPRSRP